MLHQRMDHLYNNRIEHYDEQRTRKENESMRFIEYVNEEDLVIIFRSDKWIGIHPQVL